VSDSSTGNEEERFPRVVHGPNRFSALSLWLQRSVIVIALLAVLTMLLPATFAIKTGMVLVVLLISLPLARVLWFVQRWIRRGDLRFASVAAAVLLVVAAGALLAMAR